MGIQQTKILVFDIDGTICPSGKKKDQKYMDLDPFWPMVRKIREYKDQGFYIILFTARQMRTYEGNIGLINANTLKELFPWLDKHNIPYDEVHIGKPWPGSNGFYIDDRAIRPSEFMLMSHNEIEEKLKNEKDSFDSIVQPGTYGITTRSRENINSNDTDEQPPSD